MHYLSSGGLSVLGSSRGRSSGGLGRGGFRNHKLLNHVASIAHAVCKVRSASILEETGGSFNNKVIMENQFDYPSLHQINIQNFLIYLCMFVLQNFTPQKIPQFIQLQLLTHSHKYMLTQTL